MAKQPLDSQDVIGLLSKLKESAPDYPADLFAARKTAFLQQIATINIDGSGLSGKGGGDGGLGGSAGSGGTGGSGALGGLTTVQTVMLQAVIGVWVVAAMLTAAYVFRDQIIDLLQDNGIVEITQAPVLDSPEPTVLPVATETEVPTITVTSPSVTPEPGDSTVNEDAPEQATPDSGNDDPGLHLGQTPGTPDTPNQDKPNKPDQEKSDTPDKTDKKK